MELKATRDGYGAGLLKAGKNKNVEETFFASHSEFCSLTQEIEDHDILLSFIFKRNLKNSYQLFSPAKVFHNHAEKKSIEDRVWKEVWMSQIENIDFFLWPYRLSCRHYDDSKTERQIRPQPKNRPQKSGKTRKVVTDLSIFFRTENREGKSMAQLSPMFQSVLESNTFNKLPDSSYSFSPERSSLIIDTLR